jgi:hypothetical protein
MIGSRWAISSRRESHRQHKPTQKDKTERRIGVNEQVAEATAYVNKARLHRLESDALALAADILLEKRE